MKHLCVYPLRVWILFCIKKKINISSDVGIFSSDVQSILNYLMHVTVKIIDATANNYVFKYALHVTG